MSTQVSVERRQKLASISAAGMANRDTPLIRNAWCVAARSDEIGRKLFSRQYLGISEEYLTYTFDFTGPGGFNQLHYGKPRWFGGSIHYTWQ